LYCAIFEYFVIPSFPYAPDSCMPNQPMAILNPLIPSLPTPSLQHTPNGGTKLEE
jgi:hypothetical protein